MGRGGWLMGKIRIENFFDPPLLQTEGKLFVPPPIITTYQI
jgi:hypothetical protein